MRPFLVNLTWTLLVLFAGIWKLAPPSLVLAFFFFFEAVLLPELEVSVSLPLHGAALDGHANLIFALPDLLTVAVAAAKRAATPPPLTSTSSQSA